MRVICLLLAAAASLHANGFYIPVQDPFAASRGNAFVATADRPSAVFYNPAGLTQLDSAAVHLGVYGVRLGIDGETAIDGGRSENHFFTSCGAKHTVSKMSSGTEQSVRT